LAAAFDAEQSAESLFGIVMGLSVMARSHADPRTSLLRRFPLLPEFSAQRGPRSQIGRFCAIDVPVRTFRGATG
jgi:hypothetical protein